MTKDERGFSLVELLIATAVTGLIVNFLGTAIYQIITVTGYGNDRLSAIHELQNAAHWFNLDGQRAVSASTNGDLVLVISENTSITYSLVGTELRRNFGGAQMILARNITSANFSIANHAITMTLNSSPEGRPNVNEQGTYHVYLRPTEGGDE